MKNKNQDLIFIDIKNKNHKNEKEIDKAMSKFVINVNEKNQEERKKRMKIQN